MTGLPEPSLDSARMKLARSEELLDKLDRVYREKYPKGALHGFGADGVEEYDEHGNRWLYLRWPEDAVLPEPPLDWGMLVGDAAHNARTALDHLAYQLWRLNGTEPGTRSQFPIFWDPPDQRAQRRMDGWLKGMSQDHQDQIKALQPYNMPGTAEAGKLTALAGLDNLDKHQLVHAAFMVTSNVPKDGSFVEVELSSLAGSGEVVVDFNEGAPLRPGQWLMRWRNTGIGDPNVKAHALVSLAFGDEAVSRAELREIRAYVVGIIESFAPEFP